MNTATNKISKIIKYLRSQKLPRDEITYLSELIPQIVENAFEELQNNIKNLYDEIDELQDEVNRGKDKIGDMQDEIEGHLGTFLKIQKIINEHENNS